MLSSGPLRSARRIEPEFLDHAPPEQAERSLDDLIRINRFFGGHAVLRRTLARILDRNEAFSMLDVGAGSGDMGVALREKYPRAAVTSLDYRFSHVMRAPAPRVGGDAFRLPFRPRSFDLVHCSLFLHHFRNRQIIDLLRGFGAIARRFVVITDLERHRIPYLTVPATRFVFRWHPITLHDAPISVAAGFRAHELHHLASVAGLRNIAVQPYRPAFRIALTAEPPD